MIDLALFILLGIVTVALAVFGGHVSSGKIKHRIAFYVMGGISIVLIIIMGWRNYLAQVETQKASDRLDSSIESLKKSSEAIANMSKETVRIGQLNTQLQERLLQQSKTISGLSKECIDTAKGGNSFGYISGLNICSSDHWIPTFVHKGKYPLYGVSARIVDLEKWREISKGASLLQHFSADTDINVSDTVEGWGRIYFNKSLPITRDGKEHAYNVFIFARNGSWSQQLKVINVNGECSYASRVYRDGGKKENLLFEHISDDFRKNYKGDIDWSNH
jgi:hypothetical protein